MLISLVFLFDKLIRHFREIPDFIWGPRLLLIFVVAITLSAITVAIGAYAWGILLRGGGIALSLRQVYMVMGQAQIAKYLPGNVFQYLGRLALGTKIGIPAETILLSIGVETLLVIVTATIIAVIGLFFDRRAFAWLMENMDTNVRTLILLIVFLSVAIVPILLFYSRRWIYQRLSYLHPSRLSMAMGLYLTVFIVFGMLISLLLKVLWGIDSDLKWYKFAWGFALAWVMGFIVPGAPGGLGIREAVFIGLYSRDIGEGVVIGLAFILRVVTIMGDLLAFGLAYWIARQKDIER